MEDIKDKIIETATISDEPAVNEPNPLEIEIAELKDKYMRAVAEGENIKRRAALDAQTAARAKMLNLAENILPVIDAARAALTHNPEDAGIKMILDAALAALEKSGIRPIKAVGEKLNPALHQAISTIKSDDTPAGIITEEFQSGFEMDGTPLRFALVSVAG